MAKISIKSILNAFTKNIGENIEIDDDEKEKVEEKVEKVETPKDVKTEPVKVNTSNSTVNVVGDKNEKVEVKKKMVLPKYNKETGLFEGLSSEGMDAELSALLKSVNDSVKAQNQQRLIDNALSEKLQTVKLIDGISEGSLKKLINSSAITVNSEGTVIGLDEAFADLQKNNPALFKAEETKPQSSPLLEGFSPQNSELVNGVPNSFAEAFQMMNNQ